MSAMNKFGGSGSSPTERKSFIGRKIPDEITALPKHLNKIDKVTLRKILQVLVTSFEGNDVSEDSIQELADVVTDETLAYLISGLHRLLQFALRLPVTSLKQQDFQEELLELSIPEEFIPDITSVIYGSRRSAIDSNCTESGPWLPKLQGFKWRVDVAISTSVLNRVLEPSLVAEMKLSDGTVHNFEIPVNKFHELRYNVAEILKDMGHLEQRSILQIQD